MTGFGKAQSMIDGFEITVEIKSVNNRYLDIMIKMPLTLSSFEPDLREIVKKNIKRGKVSIFIDLREIIQQTNDSPVNEEKLQQKFAMLKAIKKKLNIPGEIELNHLLQFEELFDADISHIDEQKLLRQIKATVEDALIALNKMRVKEGEHCIADMTKRLNVISTIITDIKQKAGGTVRVEFEKLMQRIEELLDTKSIDHNRLEQEVALISDKVDITEELTRFNSHIVQFNQTLKRDSELGKKLTFILQEMHREANTINSKTTNVEISHQVIQVKEEIEKIREQAQNIE